MDTDEHGFLCGDVMRLLIATGNGGKVKEIRHELEVRSEGCAFLRGLEVVGLKDLGVVLEECVEDRETFVGNAVKKARHYAVGAGCLTLADDSGLCVEALGGAPGVYSARYAGVGGHGADAANNVKLMRAMAGVPEGRRGAKFVCAMALAVHGADLAVMVDEVRGELLREPRGEGGFGYDPYFYFPELGKTTAECGMAEKSGISHRGKALRRMIGWIAENAEALAGAVKT